MRRGPMKIQGPCKDCTAEGLVNNRPVTRPGPRCATHQRALKAYNRERAWALRLRAYNITPEEYWAILEAQGGKCAICQRATGAAKRLAVDHDHKCCPAGGSCGECVRGLLCSKCNVGVIGHLRDSVSALIRAVRYLLHPPAKRVLTALRDRVE